MAQQEVDYSISKSFNVINQKTKKTLVIKPNKNHKVRIVGEKGQNYELKIVKDGKVGNETFVANKKWIDASVVGPEIVKSLMTTREIGSEGIKADLAEHECENCRESEKALEEIVPTAPESATSECDIPGQDEQWISNCHALLELDGIPKNAFRYALEGLKRNSSSFATKNCYKMADSAHRSMMGLKKDDFEGLLSEGIPNKCTMVVNDFDDRIKTHGGAYKCQARSYYIDLCSGEKPVVEKTQTYLGYGTCKGKNGFTNQSGKGTSLLGFFVSHNKTFDFGQKDAEYKAVANSIRKMRGNQDRNIPSVALFGLQTTNNGAAPDYKYLHVGAYTSAGCPSLPPEKYYLIEEMAKNGPSVVVNYKEGEMEEFEKCEDEK
jgi:hypothetical protein